jgi:hypothetical protein
MRTSALKTVLLFLLTFALLGIVVASLIAPGLYAWWATPGTGGTQELVSRVVVIREATSSLMKAQAIGAGVGALIGLVVGIITVRALAGRAARKVAPPSTGAPTP